jgi:hypothetical protein
LADGKAENVRAIARQSFPTANLRRNVAAITGRRAFIHFLNRPFAATGVRRYIQRNEEEEEPVCSRIDPQPHRLRQLSLPIIETPESLRAVFHRAGHMENIQTPRLHDGTMTATQPHGPPEDPQPIQLHFQPGATASERFHPPLRRHPFHLVHPPHPNSQADRVSHLEFHSFEKTNFRPPSTIISVAESLFESLITNETRTLESA